MYGIYLLEYCSGCQKGDGSNIPIDVESVLVLSAEQCLKRVIAYIRTLAECLALDKWYSSFY